MSKTRDATKAINIAQCTPNYFINNLTEFVSHADKIQKDYILCYIFLMAFKLSFIACHSCQHPHRYHYPKTFSAHPLCRQHCEAR